MKDAFMASFFHEGVLGGAIYLQSGKVLYRTNKLQVETKYRNLEMPYNSIEQIKTGRALCFPTVTLAMKNGSSYRFIIFNRKKFLSRLNELRNLS
ncbi:hypothetical protein [Intestinimonas massiliensis (ex Afouda et al. 2020)]|uniref:hypothetical protein n=1 Tax=Intestinimonas massiliensis (ex Afouda et al. 2020) TaxID=1673721 RepID=UPI00103093E3|nr:hypothetical protein [Intestinimonas massiliensis (ex Afouda et al. 2020)]